MITVALDPSSSAPLYQQVYRQIRGNIESGGIKAGSALPSKRKLADHLGVSLRTIETAYAQLAVEGYIEAQEKRAYYVHRLPDVRRSVPAKKAAFKTEPEAAPVSGQFDLTRHRLLAGDFPFATWSKLLRNCIRDGGASLLQPVPSQGLYGLREEIASYLGQFRGMEVRPEQIIVSSGTETLLGMLCELLPDSRFAVEDPNYGKPVKVFAARGIKTASIPVDAEGARIGGVDRTTAVVLLITPSRQFPMGVVMSVGRRLEMLAWASRAPSRYLVEDDFDSEFRYEQKPVPPLHALDQRNRVIYLNTFSQTLAPSLRVAYMVLPPVLVERFRRKLSFYTCPVPFLEQATLQAFLAGGYYERHLNRMRLVYRKRRDALLRSLAPLAGKFQIRGHEAGLHILLESVGGLEDSILARRAAKCGVLVDTLSPYYVRPGARSHTVILRYSGLDEFALANAGELLCTAWKR